MKLKSTTIYRSAFLYTGKSCVLFQCYLSTRFFYSLLQFGGFFFLHTRFEHRGNGIDKVFGFLETESKHFLDHLDDGNLIGTTIGELDIGCRLLFLRGTRGYCRTSCYRRGGDAELLFDGLPPFIQFKNNETFNFSKNFL